MNSENCATVNPALAASHACAEPRSAQAVEARGPPRRAGAVVAAPRTAALETWFMMESPVHMTVLLLRGGQRGEE